MHHNLFILHIKIQLGLQGIQVSCIYNHVIGFTALELKAYGFNILLIFFFGITMSKLCL